MTQNRLAETTACLKKYLPYVDRAIIVDGGSIDDTIITLRNWSEEEPKLEFYLHPWRDDFPWQRNNYLSRVRDHTWALVSDPDEVFEESTLKAMRYLIEAAEAAPVAEGFPLIRCHLTHGLDFPECAAFRHGAIIPPRYSEGKV